MLCCVVVCARSGLCAAAVCVPAVESVWVWAHGGVDGPGRREHRRPRSNGRSTVQPGTQLRQLQVNPCLYYYLSVWCVSVSSTAEPSVSLLYFCHRLSFASASDKTEGNKPLWKHVSLSKQHIDWLLVIIHRLVICITTKAIISTEFPSQCVCVFLSSSRSYLDMAKVLVFRYLFWFVLSVVFITGATRISVFGLGYLLACFFFLLFGTQLLVKPSRTRLALWDCLIIYNVAVIISKNMLSVSWNLIIWCLFIDFRGFMLPLFLLVVIEIYFHSTISHQHILD